MAGLTVLGLWPLAVFLRSLRRSARPGDAPAATLDAPAPDVPTRPATGPLRT